MAIAKPATPRQGESENENAASCKLRITTYKAEYKRDLQQFKNDDSSRVAACNAALAKWN